MRAKHCCIREKPERKSNALVPRISMYCEGDDNHIFRQVLGGHRVSVRSSTRRRKQFYYNPLYSKWNVPITPSNVHVSEWRLHNGLCNLSLICLITCRIVFLPYYVAEKKPSVNLEEGDIGEWLICHELVVGVVSVESWIQCRFKLISGPGRRRSTGPLALADRNLLPEDLVKSSLSGSRPWFKITRSVAESCRVAEQCDVNIHLITQSLFESFRAPVPCAQWINHHCMDTLNLSQSEKSRR
ncbi:hypothetical protein TNCV_852521 [Trichonephila clavipes]|nr:hypothetical protein TNCV_852521 [Trichonephila clavipes]